MTVNSITDNSLAIWSWLSAALLTILAATLTLSPRLLLFLSESGTSLTSLEAFLALHFGIFLAALALTLVLNVYTLRLLLPAALIHLRYPRLNHPYLRMLKYHPIPS
jgi:hypothetical protein